MKKLCGYQLVVFMFGIALSCSGQTNDLNQFNSFRSELGQLKPQLIRDPFSPSTLMYETISSQSLLNRGNAGFMPSIEGMRVPKMRLKGFIEKSSESNIALLEIEGSGTFMVREGDEINIDPSRPRNAIRITNINRLSVTVETGMLGTIRVLR